MELPQLRLYLRRMYAIPRGLGLAEQLRSPRLRALLAVLGWSCAIVLMQSLQIGALGQMISTVQYGSWLREAPGIVYVLLTSLGVWAVLFLCADEMCTLAVQGRYRTPDWYSSPLESWRALLSTLLAACCACAPALTGLTLFVLLGGAWIELALLPLPPLQLPALGQLLCGLPAYCLACGLLALALRSSGLRAYLPLLLAAAGTLLSLTQYELRAEVPRGEPGWQHVLAGPGFAAVQLLALLLAGLLALWLLQLARAEDGSAGSTATLFLLLGLACLPALRVASVTLAQIGRPYNFYEDPADTYIMPRDQVPLLLRHSAATIWPSSFAADRADDGSNAMVWAGRGQWHSQALPLKIILPWRWALWLGLTLLWWQCCLAALQAQRHPQRPSALREAQGSKAQVFA